MAIGNPKRPKARLGVFIMAIALVLAAFIGAVAGLIWQSSDWFSDDPEEQVLTNESAPG